MNREQQADRWVTEQATVLHQEKTSLWVAADKASACGSCKAKSGCGTSLLAKLGQNQVAVRALLSPSLQAESFAPGDIIELAVDRNALVKVALIMYLLPLLGLILGVILALGKTEFTVASAALVGLAVGGWAASFCLRRWKNDEGLQPVVLRRAFDAGQEPVTIESLNVDMTQASRKF